MPHHSDHRSWPERAGDEVLSWFGSDRAAERRDRDVQSAGDQGDADWYEWREDVPPPRASWRDQPWSSEHDWPMTGPHLGKGPKGYKRSDDRIRDEVCQELTVSGDVDASEIDVEVTEGEVTLTGQVDSRAAKREAEDLAYRVRGVVDVQNYIKVTRQEATARASGTGGASGGLNSGPGGVAGPAIWK